jgi:hypothetical protein
VKAPPPSGLASAAPFGEFRELRTYLRMELHIYLRSSDGRAAEKQVLRLPFAALRVAQDDRRGWSTHGLTLTLEMLQPLANGGRMN